MGVAGLCHLGVLGLSDLLLHMWMSQGSKCLTQKGLLMFRRKKKEKVAHHHRPDQTSLHINTQEPQHVPSWLGVVISHPFLHSLHMNTNSWEGVVIPILFSILNHVYMLNSTQRNIQHSRFYIKCSSCQLIPPTSSAFCATFGMGPLVDRPRPVLNGTVHWIFSVDDCLREMVEGTSYYLGAQQLLSGFTSAQGYSH